MVVHERSKAQHPSPRPRPAACVAQRRPGVSASIQALVDSPCRATATPATERTRRKKLGGLARAVRLPRPSCLFAITDDAWSLLHRAPLLPVLFTAIRLSPGIAFGRLHTAPVRYPPIGRRGVDSSALACRSRDSESLFRIVALSRGSEPPICIAGSQSPVPTFASGTIGPRR